MFVDSVEIMFLNVLKEQFCLVLNQFVYVGDISDDFSHHLAESASKAKLKSSPEGQG